MKHSWKVTAILLLLFLVTQLFGLATVSNNITVSQSEDQVTISHAETIVGEPPKSSSGTESILILSLAIIIGTILILLFMKFGIKKLFKYWYLLAVFTTMAVTFGVYVTWFSANINTFLILGVAAVLAWMKVYRSNVFVHNITEVFVYTGIAVLFVSLFEGWLWAAFAILIIISLYDMFAVWQSKHMVKMAEYQTESKVFAGLSIPYSMPKKAKPKKGTKTVTKKIKTAILGGGDIAFPLIFSGAVMFDLILNGNLSKQTALLFTSIISVTTTISLAFLLYYGKKDRFYPAMPFLTAGCFLGYGLVFLLI